MKTELKKKCEGREVGYGVSPYPVCKVAEGAALRLEVPCKMNYARIYFENTRIYSYWQIIL